MIVQLIRPKMKFSSLSLEMNFSDEKHLPRQRNDRLAHYRWPYRKIHEVIPFFYWQNSEDTIELNSIDLQNGSDSLYEDDR